VRISANPMPFLRADAVTKVNEQFNLIASAEVHRDAAHAWKRTVAPSVIAGDEAPAEFAAEAAMLGMSTVDFAQLIASKPNLAAVRELERQRILLAIAAAQSPAELPPL
jgi:hypothetical protein